MPYCSNCGSKLGDGDKFCTKCGAAVADRSESERRQTYEGELHKCPNCGEALGSLTTRCPTCGYELDGTRGSKAVERLEEKLDSLRCIDDDKKRANQELAIIKNASIPNNKSDIFEFLMLAESHIDADLLVDIDPDKSLERRVCEAWNEKYGQGYRKAALLFDGDEQLAIIQQVNTQHERALKKSRIKAAAALVLKIIKHSICAFLGLGVAVSSLVMYLDSDYSWGQRSNSTAALLELVAVILAIASAASVRKSGSFWSYVANALAGVAIVAIGNYEDSLDINGSMLVLGGSIALIVLACCGVGALFGRGASGEEE